MELSVNSIGKKAASTLKVSAAFEREFNEALVHQLIVAYQAGGRQGSKAQKNRSEARGGGAKPWRQKGTGRARAGTRRSPIWVGGGRTFAAKPRDYSQKVNKKAYRAGMQSIMAELIRQERLIILDEFKVAQPKTKELKVVLNQLGIEDALIVADKLEDNARLAARNLSRITTCEVAKLSPYDLVSHEKVVMTVPAVKQLEEAWS